MRFRQKSVRLAPPLMTHSDPVTFPLRLQKLADTISASGRAYRGKAALIFAFAFLLYFCTRSPVLDEWDSVQFALGVREFNLWKHQPHPPGYPLYIFLGWCLTTLGHWDPEFSLHLLSCLGGALFVTVWFLIARLHFGERFAWLLAGTLAIAPAVWMTSTQVLTDMLGAAVLSTQLFCALLYRRSGRLRDLLGAAAVGAIATGVRPQLFAVAVVILAGALLQRRPPARVWLIGFGALIGGCLCWLLPTFYLQAKVTPDLPSWQAYPAQLYSQWRWRLDKPHAYIGASDFSVRYFGLRFGAHFLGWFGVGFGFLRLGALTLVPGALLVLTGVSVYCARFPASDREFWNTHRSWALLHIVIIYCVLPANQRYYLIIYPLVLTAMGRGFLQLPKRWRPAGFLIPAFLFFNSLPLAIQNHREEPPPMKFVRFLQARYVPAERKQVVLFVREDQRHVLWYAPEFTAFYSPKVPFATADPKLLANAKAIYTDDAALVLPPDWRLVPVAQFHRSMLIELKQRDVALYQVERTRAL